MHEPPRMSERRRVPTGHVPARLSERFELATTAATVAGQQYELLRPRSADELISEEDFAIDERIPYWADCWPSARALADHVAALDGRGGTLLELGCGIGLVSLAAAQAGFEVLATDYYADALEFTAVNCQRHAVESVDMRLVDWRNLPDRPRHVRFRRRFRRPLRAAASGARRGRLGAHAVARRSRPAGRSGPQHGQGAGCRMRRDPSRDARYSTDANHRRIADDHDFDRRNSPPLGVFLAAATARN